MRSKSASLLKQTGHEAKTSIAIMDADDSSFAADARTRLDTSVGGEFVLASFSDSHQRQ